MTELRKSLSLEDAVVAVERLRAACDWEPILIHADQALSQQPVPPQAAFALLDARAEAHHHLGHLTAEDADLEAMARLVAETDDGERAAQVALRQVDLYLRQGRVGEAKGLALATLDAARERGARHLEAGGLVALSRALQVESRFAEARDLAESARNAVAAAAATGVGAVGLGAIVTVAASTAAADITGLVLASVVGAIGFFIIPNKRRRAKQEMREKIAAMRTRLSAAIRSQFEAETTRSGQRIRDGIAPYARFVRAESEQLSASKSELGRHRGELEILRGRVEALRS